MSTFRVLVVSEQSDAREALRDVLSVEGFEVQDAASSIEGRHLLGRGRSPSVVLLGIMGVPRTGLDFVRIAEHETHLLRIAQSILGTSGSQEPQATETISVRELIERRRAHQRSVTRVLRPIVKARRREASPGVSAA